MKTLTKEELIKINKYFNACNYLSVAQLYLLDNVLLKRPLSINDIKPKVVGHFGTVPGQNFIYVHLNRIIKKYNLNMIYISGPGHGGNALTSNTYLEGSYSKIYPEITEDYEGLKKFCKQFSFPGGVSSHVSPETPGSIHEGGELGYSLSHAFGAVLDNPTLIAACVVGDGEAETGPLACSWNAIKLINPKKDGIVLPIVHLNSYKIANPTIMGRMTNDEITSYFKGLGYKTYFVCGKEPLLMHEEMAKTLELVLKDIRKIKNGNSSLYPVVILKTPKGWTGPKKVNDLPVENSFRSHQVPLIVDKNHLENIKELEKWLKSYHPEELFNEDGSIKEDLKSLSPDEKHLMGLNPNTNGGLLLKELKVPSYKKYALKIKTPGEVYASDMLELGKFIKDIVKLNPDNFRIFGPDEALSNRLNHVFEVTNRSFDGRILKTDEYLSPDGRIIDSILSEHLCEGLLEGYILTGRHGFIHSYEAFIRIIDSMASQHAKWLKVCNELPWRKDIASLNYILTSNVWQQDHNGYTHQDPGFIDHLANKKADIVRVYLPPDSNCLLSCYDHIIKTKNYINVIVASKHMRPQWLTMDEAKEHCAKGLGKWEFASNDKKGTDVVLVSIGDAPTLENMAAVKLLREYLPEVKVRFINVVDLMKLQPNTRHPHGLTGEEYNKLFTKDKPIIFNYHGYPTLIHEFTYERENKNVSVHGYMEEGTITTPFDMRVKNEIDRYHIVIDVIKHLDIYKTKKGKEIIKIMEEKLKYHDEYIKEYGIETEEVRNFRWE